MAIYLLQVKMETTLFFALFHAPVSGICLMDNERPDGSQINFRVVDLTTHFGQLIKTPHLVIAKDI
jgi:hypothetical protein